MIATALQVAAAFNLVCTGTYRASEEGSAAALTRPGEPFTTIFRIDLNRGRWCAGDCAMTYRLADVTDTMITLQAERDATASVPLILSTLNRETGQYFSTLHMGKTLALRNAQCAVAPFGGFPERRF